MNEIQSLKTQHSETVYRYYYPYWQGNGKNVNCYKHDDAKPSMSIFHKDGEYRHFCHACQNTGDCLDVIGHFEGIKDIKGQVNKLKNIVGINEPQQRKIVKTYDYMDANGNPIFQSVRYEPKDFKQRRPDGHGGWIWNLNSVQLVPYKLPDVIKSDYCFIVEGEKDVESLNALGLVASCNPQGAGKWKIEYSNWFKDKRVYILPDNDDAGRKHALQVAKSLKGVASLIKVVELQGLKEKGDISDWIEDNRKGGKSNEEIKQKLKEIVKNTPIWIEPVEDKPSLLSSLLKWNDIFNLDINTEYILDKLIPKGSITLLFGRGGIGKTSLCLQICRAIAEGLPFADLKTIKTTVIYIDFENPLNVLKERIEAIGQTENFYVWHLSNNNIQPPRLDSKDWELYKQLPKGLIVFDTLRASHLQDENNSQDMAIVISRLKELREMGFTILLLHHTPKGNDGVYKGSTALLDLVDNCISIEEVKSDEPVEFDTDNLFRFGTRIKTRYEPYNIFLKFNPNIKGFEIATDPDIEITKGIYEILISTNEPLKQKDLKTMIKDNYDLTERRIHHILKKGTGLYWEVKKGDKNAIIYIPINSVFQFFNPKYTCKTEKQELEVYV
ncbi:MAG: AAA family ATPase [Thermodesulfovibrionales bacterium]|nr:AAA family ATPase [Thermodesulfovibrionales bacterium]